MVRSERESCLSVRVWSAALQAETAREGGGKEVRRERCVYAQ